MLFEKSHVLVTGGSGFIGSAFIRRLLASSAFSGRIVNVDKLTYAADLQRLKGVETHPRYHFIQADVRNQHLLSRLCLDYAIDLIVHFAAETHVDRSIDNAKSFVSSNIEGTFSLLEVVKSLPHIHLHQVSTDEVYGSLGEAGVFSERSPYRPSSPYAATKAAADLLVKSYSHTYRLSTTISCCSNNYGPYQHEEKLIPLMISRCLSLKPLPIYAKGTNVRDWLYVDDHAAALEVILRKGKKGETYNISGSCEKSNMEVVSSLIDVLAKHLSVPPERYKRLIHFVKDRPGHDFRYGLDASKMRSLGWTPSWGWDRGIQSTVSWQVKKWALNR